MKFYSLFNVFLGQIPILKILKVKPLLLPSKRYVAITVGLVQILKLNKTLNYWKLSSLQQAVWIEQRFIQLWENEKRQLCRATMRTLEQSFSEGRLSSNPIVIECFLDLCALESEGHYNQILNELYGKGEAIFDALIYPDLSYLDVRNS